ncbi:hypothetical protein QZH41_004682 [Actinostola sp. cb2023]|nr:hypothetical protein QZH41_004682 [Actinostola sp. cb2023]
MVSHIISLATAILILVVSTNVDATCDDVGGWAKAVFEILNTQVVLVRKANRLDRNLSEAEPLEDFVQALRELPEKVEQLLKAPLSNPELKNDCFDMIKNVESPTWHELLNLIYSTTLATNEQNRGTAIKYQIIAKIVEHLNSGDEASGYVLPMEEICVAIPERKFQEEITIVDLCPNVESCATKKQPYGIRRGVGEKFTAACTSDHKCNLEKAIPMMAGVLWFKLSDWMAERMCPEKCANKQCNFVDTYEKVIHESKLLMGFVKHLCYLLDINMDIVFPRSSRQQSVLIP